MPETEQKLRSRVKCSSMLIALQQDYQKNACKKISSSWLACLTQHRMVLRDWPALPGCPLSLLYVA